MKEKTDTFTHILAPKRVDFSYNEASQLTGIVRFASTGTGSLVAFSEFEYDQRGRLEFIGHHSGTFGETHSYGYDEANRLTSYTSLVDGIVAAYTYDDRNQLTGVDYQAGDPLTDQSYGERTRVASDSPFLPG